MISQDIYKILRYYLNEREAIRIRREAGRPGPWTRDPILSKYKFTNISRSNDWTTRWVKKHWYDPNRDQPLEIQALNCAVFRYFGSAEFAEAIGYQKEWDPGRIITIARNRLSRGQKVFTGAYIITNGGSTSPKQEVVVNSYLTPFRQNVESVVTIAQRGSWQHTCEYMQKLPGIGAFMSKEIALDMLLTPVLENAYDKLTWTPVGPGAIRGLHRLHKREIWQPMTQAKGLEQMQELMGVLAQEPRHAVSVLEREGLERSPEEPGLIAEFPRIGSEYGVTDIQFSLCELDKYLRVRYKEGRPRSGYDYRKARAEP
jgi:hypothetical protein